MKTPCSTSTLRITPSTHELCMTMVLTKSDLFTYLAEHGVGITRCRFETCNTK